MIRQLKHWISSTLAILLTMTVAAQTDSITIKVNPISIADFEGVFNAMGIDIKSFDLSQLSAEPRSLYIYVDEYRDSTVKEVFSISLKRNIRYVDDFPIDSHDKVRQMYNLKPDEKVAYKMDKLSIYTIPSNDSTIKVTFNIENYGARKFTMKLHQIVSPDSKVYFYNLRPFRISKLTDGQKTPLILYGSGWYDAKFNVFRMCGESQIDPDLSTNEILTKLPHYYVIGIRAEKTDK